MADGDGEVRGVLDGFDGVVVVSLSLFLHGSPYCLKTHVSSVVSELFDVEGVGSGVARVVLSGRSEDVFGVGVEAFVRFLHGSPYFLKIHSSVDLVVVEGLVVAFISGSFVVVVTVEAEVVVGVDGEGLVLFLQGSPYFSQIHSSVVGFVVESLSGFFVVEVGVSGMGGLVEDARGGGEEGLVLFLQEIPYFSQKHGSVVGSPGFEVELTSGAFVVVYVDDGGGVVEG